jgi:YebC/PmpR family DNA-binding regulatory protein
MSGHSKWSTIKHKKAAMDSKRGKIFGQVSKMIRVAVNEGGSGDPVQNPALRVALDKAKSVNMPKTIIDRAIQKGLGKSTSGARFEEIVYEGYGPAGVGVIVRVVTDNRNRTGAEIRTMFEKSGGSLGGPGSVSYMMEVGADGEVVVKIPIPVESEADRNKLLEIVSALEEHDDVESVYHTMAA